MFKAKRLLSLATAAAMVIPVSLSGFTASGNVAPKAAKITTVTIWCAGTEQNGAGRINTAINAYLAKKKENVRINFKIMSWQDTKFKNMETTGGSDADIVFTCNWFNDYKTGSSSGYFVPLTKYLKTTEGKKIVSILGSDFLGGSKIKGVNYALPCNKEKAHDWGFLIRTDLAKKYGLTNFSSIKKTADLIPYFKKAKEDGKTALCVAGLNGPWNFLDWDSVADNSVPLAFDYSSVKTGKVIDPYMDSKSIALYKEMKTYYDAGYIASDAMTRTSVDTELATGKYFCGVDSLKPGKDKEMTNSTGFQYTQVDITSPVKSNGETTGSMMAINNYSKNKDAAFHVLYLLFTDKTVTNLLVYGQQGKDYALQSNGSIKTKKSDYAFDNGWMIGNQFNDLLLSTESKTKWNDFLKYNTKAKALPSLGFMYDATKDATIEAACINTQKKYDLQLTCGAVTDVDSTVAQFKSELAAEGISTLINDAQSQYNTWLKSKK